MKKRITLILLAVLCVVMLAACGECEHDWEKATCEEPKTCSECGETKGKAKGHEWVDATCEEPKTCSVCGETEGEPAEHVWTEATCEDASYCANCSHPNTDALGHDWVDATYDAPKTCDRCGLTEGEPLPKPTSNNLGITVEEYVAKINAALESEGYQLTYVTDLEDGSPVYSINVPGENYTDMLATFELAADGETVTGLLVTTTAINDSDKVYVTGFVSGVAWGLTNSNLTSEMVTEMMASEPRVDEDGSISYYMEQDGLGYYIIITADMIIYMVEAE